jgi:hypothetical protein
MKRAERPFGVGDPDIQVRHPADGIAAARA